MNFVRRAEGETGEETCFCDHLHPSLTELPKEAKVKMRTESSSPARVIEAPAKIKG